MRRREFITLLGGGAVMPIVARAAGGANAAHRHTPARSPDDAEYQACVGAFLQGLQQSGWTIGRNLRIDTVKP